MVSNNIKCIITILNHYACLTFNICLILHNVKKYKYVRKFFFYFLFFSSFSVSSCLFSFCLFSFCHFSFCLFSFCLFSFCLFMQSPRTSAQCASNFLYFILLDNKDFNAQNEYQFSPPIYESIDGIYSFD